MFSCFGGCAARTGTGRPLDSAELDALDGVLVTGTARFFKARVLLGCQYRPTPLSRTQGLQLGPRRNDLARWREAWAVRCQESEQQARDLLRPLLLHPMAGGLQDVYVDGLLARAAQLFSTALGPAEPTEDHVGGASDEGDLVRVIGLGLGLGLGLGFRLGC